MESARIATITPRDIEVIIKLTQYPCLETVPVNGCAKRGNAWHACCDWPKLGKALTGNSQSIC